MIDISNLSDKELFELEKRIKKEKDKRESYLKCKDSFIDRDNLEKMFESLFGEYGKVRSLSYNPNDWKQTVAGDEWSKSIKSLCYLTDLACGNFAYTKREVSKKQGVIGYKDVSLTRNKYIEGKHAERYKKVVNKLLDILVEEALVTGFIPMEVKSKEK